MTPEEICRAVRLAANPNQQIKILAELNLTTKTETKRILENGGIKVKTGKPRGMKPTVWTPEKVEAFNTYYKQGMSANRMAPLLGIARESIRKRMLCVEKESAPQLLEQP